MAFVLWFACAAAEIWAAASPLSCTDHLGQEHARGSWHESLAQAEVLVPELTDKELCRFHAVPDLTMAIKDSLAPTTTS
ncbi:hypothetical protein [Arthrobacter sp.]|uniref:hypothetical protein n=1 Tax=Arthrobacter sp. TaxID=1667 RepID=UPI002811B30C|nr:hypothetical protein [Arthrobacter sp.]